MTSDIGIISYGASGNIYNVKKALEKAGARVFLIEKKSDFDLVEKLILPGIGSFRDAMQYLEAISDILVDEMKEKPTLGICLGMHLLSKIGYEYGETDGLSLIGGEVKKLDMKCKVPHLGWASVVKRINSPILEGIKPSDNFYFMHSYEFITAIESEAVAFSCYCDHVFISVVQKDDVFGVQFHPEKSRDAGLKILENFIFL